MSQMQPLPLLLIFVFTFGLCIGSFLNVVIYRMPLEKSIVRPGSTCPSCQKAIRWWNNIPVLSYLILRGKCAHCAAKISLRYPLVELLTGILFSAVAWREPNLWLWIFQFYFVAALIASTFIDLDHWIIPDKITLPGIVLGLLASFLQPQGFWIQSIAGILFGGGLLLAVAWGYEKIAKREGLGGGDIKFLAFVGAYLGVQGALVTLILSSVLGSVLGLFLILVKGKKGATAIPFGPFLSAGALCAFLFGPELWQWYFNIH